MKTKKVKSQDDPFMTDTESIRLDKSKHLIEVIVEIPLGVHAELLEVAKKGKKSIDDLVKTAINNFFYEFHAKQNDAMCSILKGVMIKIPQEMFTDLVLMTKFRDGKPVSADDIVTEAVENELAVIKKITLKGT